MYKILFKLLGISSAVLAVTFLLTGNSTVKAQKTPESALPEAQAGVEVQRTDWSYRTLQQLASKYECLPSDNAVLTTKRSYVNRQVFTTSLSTCLQSMEELVARRRRRPAIKKRRVVAPEPVEATPVAPEVITPPPAPPVQPEPVAPAPPTVSVDPVEPEVSQQDLDNIKALVSTFDSDLAALEKRITSKSFSTTTKLVGEAIIGFSGYGGVTPTPTRFGSNNIFSSRLRLNFDTSFTGKDRLRSRLQSANTTPFNQVATNTNATRLGFDGNDGEDNTILSLIQYDFPLTDSTKVRIAATGYEFNDNQPTLNPLLNSSANGSISRFGRFNPIYRLSGNGAAVNVSQKISDELSFDVGYAVPANNNSNNNVFNGTPNPTTGSTAANANIVGGLNSPNSVSSAATLTPINTSNSNNNGSGFFSGQNVVLSQLTYSPSKDFSLAALYGRSYSNLGNLTGNTGTLAANSPFGNNPTTADHYSFMATYKISDGAVISGWAGFINANQVANGSGNASVSDYAVTLAFPDFGAEGNMLGFVFGIPPKLNSRTTFNAAGAATNTDGTGNPNTSYHLEALYKIKLNDNMDITPGLLLITSPEANSSNKTEYVGTFRTTYRF